MRKSARSDTSGSRAAFSMTVVPLASTAAMRTLSVAVWLGYSNTIRCPTSAAPGATRDATLDVAVHRLEHGPQRRQAVQMDVDGAVAEVVAAGQRHAGPARAGQQGPEHHHRGAHLLHQLVGRLGDERRGRVDDEVAGPTVARSSGRRVTCAPMAASTSAMISTSTMRGTPAST